MPEILYRDDVNKFSVYRLADIPDGVPSSGWGSLDYWRSGRAVASGRARGWLSEYTALDRKRWMSSGMEQGCCAAVADEHAGPLLQPASRFAVGMRVRPSADALKQPGAPMWAATVGEIACDGRLRMRPDEHYSGLYLYDPVMWEPEPAASVDPSVIVTSYVSRERCYSAHTKDLGAQWGEVPGRHGRGMHATDRKHWSAHLRYLVQQSAERDRQREAAACGWDPFGDY